MGFVKFLSIFLCIASVSSMEPQLKLAELSGYALPGEFPFQVSIQFNKQHVCGGSLISRTHVLTAGHCFFNQVKRGDRIFFSRVVVEVGSTNIGSGKTHKIKKVSQRKDFNLDHHGPYLIPNDVAIITLKEAVTPSAHVGTIPLPSEGHEVPTGAYVTVLGFGNEKSGGPTSMRLRKSFMRILSLQECNDYWTGKTILSTQICASWGHGYGTCQGDSGGPLIYGNQVIGIVSAGDNMCNAGTPDIYTKVSKHVSFIKNSMSGHNVEEMNLILDDSPDHHESQLTKNYVNHTPKQKQEKLHLVPGGRTGHLLNSVTHSNTPESQWEVSKPDSIKPDSQSTDSTKSQAPQDENSQHYPAYVLTETSKYPIGWWRIALPKDLKKKPPSPLELHLIRLRNLTSSSETTTPSPRKNMTASLSDENSLQPKNVTSL